MTIKRRLIATLLVAILAITILPAVDSSAAVEKVANASKFVKKLKKNTLSKEPNLDSGLLTLGYATYKIQKAIESDSNAYVFYGTSIYEAFEAAGKEIKYVASSKKQRAALKWGVSSFLVSWIDKAHPERNIQLNDCEVYCGLFDGNDLLTRRGLIELMGRVTALFYSGRMQVVYREIDGGLDYYASQGDGTFDQTAIYKGLVVFPEVSWEDVIDVDEPATKEDLSRVLKNLKIASKYYTAKLVRRNQPLEQYTAKDAKKDVERLNKYLAKKTGVKNIVKLLTEDNTDYYYDFTNSRLLEISSWSSITFSWYDDGSSEWSIGIGFSRLGYDDFYAIGYNPIEIDVIGTLINIFKKRL